MTSDSDFFLDAICERFDTAWSSPFDPPAIEPFLLEVGVELRERLLSMLIEIDIEYRLLYQQTCDREYYTQCLPQYDSELNKKFASISFHRNGQSKSASKRKAGDDDQTAIDRTIGVEAGDIVGPYKLLEKIGEGGMGVVYIAQQKAPLERRVALKVIKLGMDTKQVISRFEAERQALALMNHPNIACVLDAGATESGKPYFVMEHVDGIAINNYCDQQKLSVKERLQLFLPICHAIQHAHQKGVIHRDIKPSNVLVCRIDGQAVPKVIDFGLAKATHLPLTDKTICTRFGELLGTFEYMSPEQTQFSQIDIDTRSDIYSLGALLYELLCGAIPFDKARLRSIAVDEVLKIIRDEDPPRPSIRASECDELPSVAAVRRVDPIRLQSLLRGDIDWIVMKALEKDRSRRYETAGAFADEVDRYLRGEAIEARPPSFVYRAKKFVSRNRLLATSAAFVSFTLVFGIAGMSWFAYRANLAAVSERKEKNVAEQRSVELATALQTAGSALARSRFFLAMARLNENRVSEALETLDLIPEGSRDLAWKFARQKCLGSYLTLYGHESPIIAVAMSPDGKTIASAGEGPNIYIWSTIRGEEVRIIKAQRIESLAFSPDPRGEILASGSFNGTVQLWNWQTGECLKSHSEHDARVSCVTFSPDGKWIASGSRLSRIDPNQQQQEFSTARKGTIKVWDIESQKTIHTLVGHSNHVHDVVFSPDGKTLASSGMRIFLWNLENGELKDTLHGHEFHVPSIAFSPDGNQLVSAGDRGRTAIVWDLEQNTQRHILRGHHDFLTDVAFSPDGKTIATSSADRTIALWSADTGKRVRTLKGHQNWVCSVVFSPTSTVLVSASRDRNIKFWDLGVTDELKSIKQKSRLNGLAWCDKNQIAATAGPGDNLGIWNLETSNQTLAIPTGHSRNVSCVALSPDGKSVASGGRDNVVRVWDTETGKELLELQSSTNSSVSDVVFSPDGRMLAAAGSGVDVWEANSGKPLLTFDKHREHVFGLAFSPDSRLLASASADNSAKIWNPLTGEVKMTLDDHPFWVYDVAFSPEGTSIATVSSSEVSLWDTNDGKKLRTYSHENVRRICFADETRIITGNDSAEESTLKIWDLDSGEELLTLNGHRNRIEGLVFATAKQAIVSVGSDATVKVWKPTPQPDEHHLEVPRQFRIRSVVFDADGTKVFCGSYDGEKLAWDVRSRRKLTQFDAFPEFDNLTNKTSDGWLALRGDRYVRLINLRRQSSNKHSAALFELNDEGAMNNISLEP